MAPKQAPAPQIPKTVPEHLLEWSVKRPMWMRDTLRRIVQTGKVTDSELPEVLSMLKEDQGGPKSSIVAVPFSKQHLPSNPGAGDSVSLLELSGVKGINNLASGQLLQFSPGLTIIYGDNGSGKSGYARILKRSCRARNPGNALLANIYASTIIPIEATLLYSVGGVPQAPQTWNDQGVVPVLSAISVFDSSCAAIHIGNKNDIASKPFGLDIPDELADTCKRLEKLIDAEQVVLKGSQKLMFSKPPWRTSTKVGKALGSLDSLSDMVALQTLAKVSTGEQERAKELKEALAIDPTAGAKALRLNETRLISLANFLASIDAVFSGPALTSASVLHEQAATARAAAQMAAAALFSADVLPGVAGPVWKNLWDSARRYSQAVAYPGRPFPPATDQLCVLCEQPLSVEAVARMQGFEAFIQDDTEQKAQGAERLANEAFAKFQGTSLLMSKVPTAIEDLKLGDKLLYKEIARFLAAARLRRFLIGKQGGAADALVVPLFSPASKVRLAARVFEVRAKELDTLSGTLERQRLNAEMQELEDRITLQSVISDVEVEINRLKAIAFLDRCCKATGTTAISTVGNVIADDVVTPQLRNRFQTEIVGLAANKVNVEIVRSGGRYGSPQYKVQLFAKADAKVSSVLSEGEQTCVALAAFLTELATANHKSALVFDDPVTSLDHRWRQKVAERLVTESAVRQIIVFTHDLTFANDLDEFALKLGSPRSCVTVCRGKDGTGEVHDQLPWKGAPAHVRLLKLKKNASEARILFQNSQDDEYSTKVHNLYSELRSTWERALEDVAFGRVIVRYRDYINTSKLLHASVLTDPDCRTFQAAFKKCCDFTDAHDHSYAKNTPPPAPSEIDKDLQELEDWMLSLKQRQKPYN